MKKCKPNKPTGFQNLLGLEYEVVTISKEQTNFNPYIYSLNIYYGTQPEIWASDRIDQCGI